MPRGKNRSLAVGNAVNLQSRAPQVSGAFDSCHGLLIALVSVDSQRVIWLYSFTSEGKPTDVKNSKEVRDIQD
jgi:hypothetical protein